MRLSGLVQLPERGLMNAAHLGLSFLVLFSADFTITNMQKTINTSITEDKPEYTIDGYLTLCLLYGIYGLTLWLAPSSIALTGWKINLVVGGSSLAIYMFSMIFENMWVSYFGILLGGAGGSFLWAAEGHYLVLNSDQKTMDRNIAVFWAIYSASMIPGNIFAATLFAGKTHIDQTTRHTLLITMGCLAIGAVIMFALLRAPSLRNKRPDAEVSVAERPLQALQTTWGIFITKDMMILLLTFIYVGFQQSFGSGVYSPCLGFTKDFGTMAKQLVPISGILYGVGDSLGGVIYMIMNRMNYVFARRYIVLFGFLIQLTAYVGTFINLPNAAVFGETNETAFIHSQVWLALLCSFLIGFGDSCFNTQIFPILRDMHPEFSAHTCALYKFSKSMAIAGSFFLSSYMGLHIQVLVMAVLGLAAIACFWLVDLMVTKRRESFSLALE